MLAKLRPRSAYDVMAALALLVALSTGGAYASHLVVDSSDVVDNSLTGADVRGKPGTSSTAAVNGSLTTDDIAGQQANAANGTPFVDGTLTQWDLKNGSVTGSDVLESSLAKVPDANKLDGLDSTAFTQRACFNQSGAVKGYARIQANPGFSPTFTTVGVNFPYNCSGATVEARRVATGVYEVKFNGNPAELALANTLDPDGNPDEDIASVATIPGAFRVEVRNMFSGDVLDEIFMIAVFF